MDEIVNDLKKDPIDIENQIVKEKIRKMLAESYDSYKKTMQYMSLDAPIETLCLSKKIEKILTDNGLIRIYDLMGRDLTEIEGFSASDIRWITASFNKFVSMS
jgi:hypothetical protein